VGERTPATDMCWQSIALHRAILAGATPTRASGAAGKAVGDAVVGELWRSPPLAPFRAPPTTAHLVTTSRRVARDMPVERTSFPDVMLRFACRMER